MGSLSSTNTHTYPLSLRPHSAYIHAHAYLPLSISPTVSWHTAYMPHAHSHTNILSLSLARFTAPLARLAYTAMHTYIYSHLGFDLTPMIEIFSNSISASEDPLALSCISRSCVGCFLSHICPTHTYYVRTTCSLSKGGCHAPNTLACIHSVYLGTTLWLLYVHGPTEIWSSCYFYFLWPKVAPLIACLLFGQFILLVVCYFGSDTYTCLGFGLPVCFVRVIGLFRPSV